MQSCRRSNQTNQGQNIMFETPVKEVTLVTCTHNDKLKYFWTKYKHTTPSEWSYDGNARVTLRMENTEPNQAGRYKCTFEGKTETSRATANLKTGEVY